MVGELFEENSLKLKATEERVSELEAQLGVLQAWKATSNEKLAESATKIDEISGKVEAIQLISEQGSRSSTTGWSLIKDTACIYKRKYYKVNLNYRLISAMV